MMIRVFPSTRSYVESNFTTTAYAVIPDTNIYSTRTFASGYHLRNILLMPIVTGIKIE